MERKILFFDIDGTLIDSFHGHPTVSASLKEAFQQLQKQGYLCFIASGRPLAYLNDDIMSVGFDGYVLCNGAMVIKDGEVIHETLMPNDLVREIAEVVEKNGNNLCFNYKREVYTSMSTLEENELFSNEVLVNGDVYYEYDVDSIKTVKVEINQLEEKTEAYLKGLEDKGYVVVWYPTMAYAEITMPDTTKGQAIEKVLNILDISKENSIAFGDGDNDIEMFNIVGHSVAMGNGTSRAKQAADVITDTCANEGIVLELQRLGLVKDII